MTNILDIFESLLKEYDMAVVERLELPAREARCAPTPDAYKPGPIGRWLAGNRGLENALWRHQAIGLAAAAGGQNVVLSTGTASGKTLVFQAIAFRALAIDPDARIAVFYPMKALAADQLRSWESAARLIGLPDGTIAKIDGDAVIEDRTQALKNARVIIMTPDICHAWLMSRLADAVHKRFLAALKLVVIDEAHVLEAVLGSNFAFLFRRLQAARNLCRRTQGHAAPLQVIAASATIENPADHLRALTGLDFLAVGEDEDGSPQHERSLLHIACRLQEGRATLAELQRELLQRSDEGSFITFVDSRQGVERLAIQSDVQEGIRPYRSGYEAADRSRIEDSLRSGRLRGVVSTSALELGINISHFCVGLNIGVPSSRKAFRQRLGRVGRNGPGIFAVIAEPHTFHRYGTTLKEYYSSSVEASHLYLANRFVQFAHARCLAEELDMCGVINRKTPPCTIEWPAGFVKVFDFAVFGGNSVRPREFDHIAQIGADAPHYNYPLRHVPEESFVVRQGGGRQDFMPDKIGRLSLQQAASNPRILSGRGVSPSC